MPTHELAMSSNNTEDIYPQMTRIQAKTLWVMSDTQ